MQIIVFADGDGIVVICNQCRHFATSNTRCQLHKVDCPSKGQATFLSAGAKAAYERVCLGKHPKHAKGKAKVLDRCMAAEALLGFAAHPATETEFRKFLGNFLRSWGADRPKRTSF